MNRISILIISAICSLMCIFVADASDNVAYKDKNVRITLVTDGLARLEYSPSGNFVDDPSFVAVNRDYPEVKYSVKDKKNMVTISTGIMKIEYKKTGAFDKNNLKISSMRGVTPAFIWKPGDSQKGNLGGTLRTLDRMNGSKFDGRDEVPMPDGLLATDGWTLIDDSSNFLFDDSDWAWVKKRSDNSDSQDWYFLAYGDNYKKALKDFTILSGKVPLPPRYAFGYWWSRYYAYSDAELRNLIKSFQNYNIPLDVLVIDMDWHNTDEGRGGWTGYTWNDRLFPDYRKLLSHIKDNDLKVTLNLHPADGVAAYETQYADVAKDMGIDPASKKTVEWLASDKKFMNSMFNRVFHPYEKDGVDFWWLDWQQWPEDKAVAGLNNTWWLNYCFFTDMERNSKKRPMLYHRWGGLGNHRYQIGFSGDSHITWESLDYQPYFNSTASNVLYGYWSHDLGGHQSGEIIPEMYIRWMQFGALSPVMRTHSTKSSTLNKEPWVFSHDDMDVLVKTIKQRYEMVPYIYTMARKCYDDGISLCRPMYYDYPTASAAYDRKNDYMFGDNILVSPITTPMSGESSSHNVWLPEGNDWWELHTGTLLNGGQNIERYFSLDEYPIYIKAGSILPSYPANPQNLNNNAEPIQVNIYPGSNSGSFVMYEDNGDDQNYVSQNATTTLGYQRTGNTLDVKISPAVGSYADKPSERKYSVKVISSAVPTAVTVNGKKTDFIYDGNDLSLIVNLGEISTAKGADIQIAYSSDAQTVGTDGAAGRMRRAGKAVSDLRRNDAGVVLSDDMGILERTPLDITYRPAQLNEILNTFNACYESIPAVLEKMNVNPERTTRFKSVANPALR